MYTNFTLIANDEFRSSHTNLEPKWKCRSKLQKRVLLSFRGYLHDIESTTTKVPHVLFCIFTTMSGSVLPILKSYQQVAKVVALQPQKKKTRFEGCPAPRPPLQSAWRRDRSRKSDSVVDPGNISCGAHIAHVVCG